MTYFAEGETQELEIHYCRGEQSDSIYELWVNGDLQQIIRFAYTGDFTAADMVNHRTEATLKAGTKNELCLKKAAGRDAGIFVDAFAVKISG